LRVVIFGATSAIANETAKCFAADGADLVLVGRDATRLEANAADLTVRGARQAETLVADLADMSTHPKLIEDATRMLGSIDAALIAHGTLGDPKLSEESVEEVLVQMNTNALSYMSLMTLLANLMQERRSG
jgi:short-subunit dehydrogenase